MVLGIRYGLGNSVDCVVFLRDVYCYLWVGSYLYFSVEEDARFRE